MSVWGSMFALAAVALGACTSEARDGVSDTRDGDSDEIGDTTPVEVDVADTTLDTTPDTHDSEVATSSPAMRIHVLDVGQGEAIIVEFPCGAMLIDSGGEVTEAAPDQLGFDSDDALEAQVRAFFAERPDLDDTFDLVVLSHPHIDHTRGVRRLIDMVANGELSIRNVLTNGAEDFGSGVFQQRTLHDWADANGVGRWYMLERKAEATGFSNDIIDPFATCQGFDPIITALWGRIDDASPLATTWDPDDVDNANNNSVVLRVDFGEASALLTGDLEDAGIGALIARYEATGLLDVDVYKAGHHGSYNGTTGALVNAMTPRAAVISSGPPGRVGDFTAWAFGHPRWRAVTDLIGDNDSGGVSESRTTPIDAPVATGYSNGHGVFETRHIVPAVYCTGWDGATVLTLHADGELDLPP